MSAADWFILIQQNGNPRVSLSKYSSPYAIGKTNRANCKANGVILPGLGENPFAGLVEGFYPSRRDVPFGMAYVRIDGMYGEGQDFLFGIAYVMINGILGGEISFFR